MQVMQVCYVWHNCIILKGRLLLLSTQCICGVTASRGNWVTVCVCAESTQQKPSLITVFLEIQGHTVLLDLCQGELSRLSHRHPQHRSCNAAMLCTAYTANTPLKSSKKDSSDGKGHERCAVCKYMQKWVERVCPSTFPCFWPFYRLSTETKGNLSKDLWWQLSLPATAQF